MKKKMFTAGILVFAFFIMTGISFAEFYVISGPRGVGTEIKELPHTITAPGFYYLKKDLSPPAQGISVAASNVTIDLMGFSLAGIGEQTIGMYGVNINGHVNVEIRNGTIREFGDHGIYNSNSDGRGYRLLSLRLTENKGSGIFITGTGHLVKGCVALNNTSYGIDAGQQSTVTENIVNNNGSGIQAGANSTVTWNQVAYNEGTGLYIFDGSYIAYNTVSFNNQVNGTYSGLDIYSFSIVKGNKLHANKKENMTVRGNGNVIEDNTVSSSTVGIQFHNTNNFFANTRASGNTTDFLSAPTGVGDGGGNVSF